MNLAEQV